MRAIIFDHDLGTNPDDFFTLLILLNSKDIHLPLVISGNNFPQKRARFSQKIITNHGRPDVVVCVGEKTGHIDFWGDAYIQGDEAEISTDYTNAIKTVLDTFADVTYLCTQGVSNLTSFLKEFPEHKNTFDIVHMGLSLNGADEYTSGGTNMEADPLRAKYLYEMELEKFKVVGSHTTVNDAIRVNPDTLLFKKLNTSPVKNHQILLHHLLEYHDRRNLWPALHDPLAASVALGKDFVSFEKQKVNFRDDGQYKLGGTTNITVSKRQIDSVGFMNFCLEFI